MVSSKSLFPIVAFLCGTNFCLSQSLQLEITTSPATCAANGSITVAVSGGSDSYSFLLEGCLLLPPQPVGTFTTLPPCTYTLTVVDDNDATLTTTQTVTVLNETEPLEASIEFMDCQLAVVVASGKPPYNYEYSTSSSNGPWTSTGDNPIIDVGQEDVWARVTDNCGNSTVVFTSESTTAIRRINESLEEDGIHATAVGGAGPFEYTLTSSLGTFTNATGIFPWAEVGCMPILSARSLCNGSTYTEPTLDIEPTASLECVSLTQGTATVIADPGREPFTYFCFAVPGGIFTNNDGVFTGLPNDVSYYEFWIEDACGVRSDNFSQTTRLQLEHILPAPNCNYDTLQFKLGRQCFGGSYSPMEVSCTNCPDPQPQTVSFFFQNFYFTGQTAGNWELLVTDACGDSIEIRDTVLLEIQPACDSVIATLVNQFIGSQGIANRRVIADTSLTFRLFDDQNNLLEDNNRTGIFTGLPLGNYVVEAISAVCGLQSASVTLTEPIPITPNFDFSFSYNDNTPDGQCRVNYSMRIEKRQGPFVISGGPDGDFYEILNNYGQDNCRYYRLSSLSPGDYTITSLSRCGTVNFTLPDPVLPTIDSVGVLNTCPGAATVEVFGELRSISDWLAIFDDYGLDMRNEYVTYRYFVPSANTSSSSSSNIIDDLTPGTHRVYLVMDFASDCPIDSIDVFIPAYEPANLLVTGDIVCDGATTSTLQLLPESGQGDFNLRLIDCNNPISTLAEYDVLRGDSLVIPNNGVGAQCFIVEDGCGLTTDYQVQVRSYASEIEWEYTCSPALELRADALAAPFTWSSNGEVLGQDNDLLLPPPTETTTYELEIALSACTIERSVTIPARPVIPLLSGPATLRDTFFTCAGSALSLTAQTDPFSGITWSGVGVVDTFVAETEAWYSLTAENELGCTRTDSFYVRSVPLPVPQILAYDGFCTGASTVARLEDFSLYTTVNWLPGGTADSIAITTPGTYRVQVTNERACLGVDSVTIVEWPLPQPEIIADAVVCPGATTTLALDTLYSSYRWAGGANAATVTGGLGTYPVTVTDQNGCAASTVQEITEYAQAVVSLVGDTTVCPGDTAFLRWQVEGVDGTASGWIINAAGTSVASFADLANGSLLPLAANGTAVYSPAQVSLAGYSCPIEYDQMAEVRVNEPTVDAEVRPLICSGDSDAAISLVTTTDFPPATYQWADGATSAALDGLASGVYAVTVTDALGCSVERTISLPAPARIRPEVRITNPICFGDDNGTLTVSNVAGGTPPYEFWLDGTYQRMGTSFSVDRLPANSYPLQIIDANDCQVDSVYVLSQPEPLFLELGPPQELTLGDELLILPQHNVSPIGSVQLDGWSDSLEVLGELAWRIVPFESTTIVLTVENTSGCMVEDTLSVIVDRKLTVYGPSGFSPNEDGINDGFTLFGSPRQIRAVHSLAVYNRWGEPVFAAANPTDLLNNESSGWDGSYLGKPAPQEVYAWKAVVEWVDGTIEEVAGSVTLLR